MERNYKITIPKPCQEDWDKMTPEENGKFCGSCSKSVVDFTSMLPDEIQVYFQNNSNICGRFKNSQLDSLTIQIPSRILYSQTQYHKMFLLALLVAMGTTLFSCADKNGNKQKVDKVEVIEDSIEKNKITLGIILPPKEVQREETIMVGKIDLEKYDSLVKAGVKMPPLPPAPPPPPKSEQVKFIKKPSEDYKIPLTTTGEVALEPNTDTSKTKNK